MISESKKSRLTIVSHVLYTFHFKMSSDYYCLPQTKPAPNKGVAMLTD